MAVRTARAPRFAVLCAILSLAASGALAAEDGSWRKLEEGKIYFSQKKLGEALEVFSLAIAKRNEDFTRYGQILDSVMATKQAKHSTDSINKLLSFFVKEDLRQGDIARIEAESEGSLAKRIAAYEAYRISDPCQNLINVLKACLESRSQDYFHDSLMALKAYVSYRRYFPEAEYWIAKVYIAEGEYDIARKQLEKAASYADSLDLPDFAFEIRYLLADIEKAQKRWVAMEGAYGAILAKDALYADDSQKSLREAMKRCLATEGIEKFLVLYRHDAFFAAKAYADTGEFYYKSGRYSPAIDRLMLATSVLTTKLVSGIAQDDLEYRYADLGDLLSRIDASETLSAFAEESGFKRTLYFLGLSLAGDGKQKQARELLQGLSGSAGRWAALAREKLRKAPIAIDRADPDPVM